jgi:hypothetical protein
MKEINKELCDCGKLAVWDYMPGYSEGGNSYSCDDCVPRGCSCNWRSETDLPDGTQGVDYKWLDEYDNSEGWVSLDENGKEYPCAEYWYSEEGWEVESESETTI